jgi:hypothetical protein
MFDCFFLRPLQIVEEGEELRLTFRLKNFSR